MPTKVLLRSAKITALARDAERFGLHVPKVEVDFAAVIRRVRVANAEGGELLGGHVGDGAGAMIHEVVAMMAGHLGARRIGDAIHAYPTLSESVKAAAAALADV